MNSPYPESVQLTRTADPLAGAAPADRPAEQGARAFWTDPYRDGHPVEDERRDRARVAPRSGDELWCSLGRIVDLSTRGVRVARRWAMSPGGEIFTFTLRSGHDELTLRGACVWNRKSGFMRHMAGVALAGLTPHETQLLRAFIDRHAAGPVLAVA